MTENRSGVCYSVGALQQQLGVSRAAIVKAIDLAGIEGVPKKPGGKILVYDEDHVRAALGKTGDAGEPQTKAKKGKRAKSEPTKVERQIECVRRRLWVATKTATMDFLRAELEKAKKTKDEEFEVALMQLYIETREGFAQDVDGEVEGE